MNKLLALSVLCIAVPVSAPGEDIAFFYALEEDLRVLKKDAAIDGLS
jgi:hypothetical protein